VLQILSDSTAPDPTNDGRIPTYDLAQFRLNVSQNGAASVGNVAPVITLTNGRFIDSDPATPGINPPPVCDAGSTISADQKTLTCNLGPLDQGTSVALDYAAQASGDIDPGDMLTSSVTVGGQTLESEPLEIYGTPAVDISKRLISVTAKPSAAGTNGYFVQYALDVRTSPDNGKGSLPLSSVSFRDNFSDLVSTFPNARLVTNGVPGQQQQTPVGLNRIAPVKSLAGNNGGTFDQPEYLIPQPGTWTTSNATATSIDITVSGFSNDVISAAGSTNRVVSSGVITFFVPDSDVPIGNTPWVNSITNVVGVPRDGSANVSDYDATNNSANASIFKVIGAAYRVDRSAWSRPDYGFETGRSNIFGNFSSWNVPFLIPAYETSGGEQRVFSGQNILADIVATNDPDRYVSGVTSTLNCVKFNQTVSGTANARADVFGYKTTFGDDALIEIAHSPITIQYATLSGNSAASKCDTGTWTSTRPATFNAVRSYTNVSAGAPTANAQGRSVMLWLKVPVTVPAGTNGSNLGFWNTSVNGSFTSGGPVNSSTISSNVIDGYWSGTGDPPLGDDDSYNIPNNTGNARYGDRVIRASNVGIFSKKVCGTDGATQQLATGDVTKFCLEANIEGIGAVNGLTITDESIGDATSPYDYLPGTARVIVNGTSTAVEPTVAGGQLVWNVNGVTAPATVRVEFDARSIRATPGESFANVGNVNAAGWVDFSDQDIVNDPHRSQQAVSFRSGRYQLNVTKSTSSPSVTYPNTPVVWDLHLNNQGESAIGSVDVIDVLPYNGDTAIDRVPGSTFTGTAGLASFPTLEAGVEAFYTKAAPATISSNPIDPSNEAGGTTEWLAAADVTDADLPAITAVRFKDSRTLLSGDSVTYTVTTNPTDNAAGDVYTNDVGGVVQEGEDGPILPIRSNDVAVTVQTPGLDIVKTTQVDENGDPIALAVDDEVTYNIVTTNNGGIAEPNAVVTDALRDGVSFVEASDGGVYDAETHTVIWPGVAIDAGDAVTYTLTVKIDRLEGTANTDVLDENNMIPNTAKVTGEEDCVPADDGSQDEKCESTVTNPPKNPHLTQNKVVDKDVELPENVLTYTVTVGNDGDATATNVVASDSMPDEVTFDADQTIAVDKGEAVYNEDGTITWTIGDLEPGETVEMTFTATINKGTWDTSFVNRVIATHDPGDCVGSCEPPTVENPCEDDGTFSCAPTRTPKPSLRQDKVVDLGEAKPGDVLTYTVSITNEGEVTADAYTAVDELPEGLTFQSATNGGTYDDATRVITWDTVGDGGLPVLEPGDRVDITVKATINDGEFNSEFINKFQVTPPGDWPPTNVDNPCVDEASKSCAVTVTPAPVPPIDGGGDGGGGGGSGGGNPIPVTGAGVAGIGIIGVALIAGGLVLARRRRDQASA
jgi:uncharacterized repeat protein (TIGR01451 family)/LPXTG-motif cell wall-anchored protein